MSAVVSVGVSGIGPGDRKDPVMADSPVRISVELEGIEPNDRLRAAFGELVAAATELVGDSADTSGFAYDLNPNDLSFKQVRPTVKSFSFGVERFTDTATTY